MLPVNERHLGSPAVLVIFIITMIIIQYKGRGPGQLPQQQLCGQGSRGRFVDKGHATALGHDNNQVLVAAKPSDRRVTIIILIIITIVVVLTMVMSSPLSLAALFSLTLVTLSRSPLSPSAGNSLAHAG